MDQERMEIKLREHGFTERDIAFLKSRQKQHGHASTSLHSLLKDLRKRLFGACALVAMLLLFSCYATLHGDTGNGPVYFAFTVLCCIYILGITPVGIAWKAVLFLKREK